MKRSPIKPGAKSLERGSTFEAARSELERTAPKPRRRGISPASREQRAKVKGAVCRQCGNDIVHPAHVIDRSLGGCDDPLCVIALCPLDHRLYDEHRLDILPLLNHCEQAHAVSHLGIVGALERTTNHHWTTEARA